MTLRLVYLRTALHDMSWFRTYYRFSFPEGAKSARNNLQRAEALIAESPLVGRAYDDAGTRYFPILRTPFAFLYVVETDEVQILRVLDNRRG